MWLRRAFYGWLIPAAFVVPLWLLVGWGVFNAGGWAFLWVLFLAIPGVFLWELLLTLLVRARGTVRAHRAVSWWDVLGFTVWHLLVISLGFYNPAWWAPMLVVAILVGVGLFWLELWQLWSEAKPSRIVLRTTEGMAYITPAAPRLAEDPQDVIVITEKHRPTAS
jgi:hypothetical protein